VLGKGSTGPRSERPSWGGRIVYGTYQIIRLACSFG
jgi:hypothetical protein